MKFLLSITVGLAMALTSFASLAAGDIQAGRAAAATCMGCHGASGMRNAYPAFRIPKLGGQQAEYLMLALKAYQNAERVHPTMKAQAGALSGTEITNIAAYLSGLEATAASERGDGDAKAGEAKAQACATCHGAGGGKPITPQYPILAGQYPDFLAHALTGYKSGARNNAIMKGFASALSDSDIQDLAAYFSSQPSTLSTPTNW
ncbi:MAG TPA: cytochrome c family protein [Gammaproteobacteria bacterium]|jgi:cytochrome c553|nr:cytochrome c family protein [Acidiferrobacteraceae bacterium]MDP6397684.1 c-type cytochrome [Arenicellales bacterium]HCX88601.1 cytochrome c family protein [Gammaproteobacteria bacterium]MDP6551427.1 c-type cytochrome [Arenicellales bacterium]MDP6790502.1 c-type cytochrome [Arenicellales bacterium]|tara:strand:- start:9488 stop:10099 length:612 start_codon:yes stop_codon:yes gene_type:complete